MSQFIISFEVINSGYSVSQHELTLRSSNFTKSTVESAQKRITKIFCSLMFCLDELGVWLALKVLFLPLFCRDFLILMSVQGFINHK